MSLTQRQLIGLTFAAVAALAAGTTALRSWHERVRTARVEEHLARARGFAERNELASAVPEYRAALSLEREHAGAARALALALVSLGRLSEAESYLRELLRRDPADGALNRGLARIHVARGREAEARAVYQRAIYGDWPGGGLEERVETRFELIDYLTELGAGEEVLAELLRLRAELPAGQTSAARRVADLIAQHGAPELAVDVLRTAAGTAPRDTDLLAHLAEMLGSVGRTREARAALADAVSIEPGREELRDRLAVADRVLAMDPTLPGLRLVARTRRARLVLAAVVEATRACADDDESVTSLRQEAAARLRRRARADAEAAEEDLALASRLWAAAPSCHRGTPEARAVAQVMSNVNAWLEPRS